MKLTWKNRLQPFGYLYNDMREQIRRSVQSMDDAELAALSRACDKPGRSNCWWATYAVAPIVRDVVEHERWARKVARKAARSA